MATTARVGSSRTLRRRRIIERPRLLALLDETPARVRMLIAPAGYGKTTLAEQWVARDGRRGTWFKARRASTDVAALALGLAQAASKIVPGCEARLREHLRAVPNPGEHVDVLAEILGEDLADWSPKDWLVIDEYQELADGAEAQQFVAELLARCPVQILVVSRQRPVWATGRSILYGEFFELNQTMLAMDSREAAEVLGDDAGPSASGLVALANGWPAVIALASVSSAVVKVEEIPESLYRFFAEEVFDALGKDVREGLSVLAVAPVLDRELAGALLGSARIDLVCTAGFDVGVLEERGDQLELHPLARSFIDERLPRGDDGTGRSTTAAICVEHYRARRDWDAAFDVVSRRGPIADVESLLKHALDDLLETARLPTIETWCEVAASHSLDGTLFSLARAEVALRRGRHAEAQAFAEAAAAGDHAELAFRALSVAGRAAHLASREEDGLDLYRRAEVAATTEDERRDARWGRFLCALELELPDTAEILHSLTASADASPRERVRTAAYELGYQLKSGNVDITDVELVLPLLDSVSDPLVRTSFQNVYAHVLALSARYEEALEQATSLLALAREYRLDFALPYGALSSATAAAGLRRWKLAMARLGDVDRIVESTHDPHVAQLAYAVRVRVFAQQGKHRSALTVGTPSLRRAVPAVRAEVLASRALALVMAERLDEAVAFVEGIRASTTAVEPTVLLAGIDALVSLKHQEASAPHLVARFEELAFSTGAVDLLVTMYRASAQLLATLLHASRSPERIGSLIRRLGDDDLARAVGRPVVLSEDDQRELLSPREREVYELLRHGLANKQIAEALFISEATVKLHAHHIYDKLGTRSRTALAIQAALERHDDQATSATETSDLDSAS